MVVDTSAVVAIFLQEPEADRFAAAIGTAEAPLISAASVLEASIVLRARKRLPAAEAERWLDEFLNSGGFRIEPVTPEHIGRAREAHLRYGKGSGHPAGLNFGDCFAYALAKATGSPPLFEGDDFARTDIPSALDWE